MPQGATGSSFIANMVKQRAGLNKTRRLLNLGERGVETPQPPLPPPIGAHQAPAAGRTGVSQAAAPPGGEQTPSEDGPRTRGQLVDQVSNFLGQMRMMRQNQQLSQPTIRARGETRDSRLAKVRAFYRTMGPNRFE